MSVLKCDNVRKSLKKKGFLTESGKQKHVIYTFHHNGVPAAVATHMSHNNQEISDTLQSMMAEQLHLSKGEFVEMISCKTGHAELAARYAALGLLR
ncbi:hypothetical protein McpSp1_13770 [Methanocorpusculaceae archaeon Sp1]|uniref:Type II toxin-antitoxin system HicA family toxin n=1 Tax=Methanorbis furvi TaxID=3028299 RepID=A0AAE4MC26_9EURY|nr:hypothetical protein [Methanocorpusculaceae archaeon Sp1]MDV0441345.1 hypothetical protein [Methanocorpusculaceae archaeon Ag1]